MLSDMIAWGNKVADAHGVTREGEEAHVDFKTAIVLVPFADERHTGGNDLSPE
jgi:hypothetical protein